MTDPVIDLAGLQAARDAQIRHGRAVMAASADHLAERIVTWVARAHQAHARLSEDDPELAHGAAKWCLRRLRYDVRRIVGRDLSEAVRADMVGLSESAFDDRFRALEAARVGDNGAAT